MLVILQLKCYNRSMQAFKVSTGWSGAVQKCSIVLISLLAACRCANRCSSLTFLWTLPAEFPASLDDVCCSLPGESHSLAAPPFSTHFLSVTWVLMWSNWMEKTNKHAEMSFVSLPAWCRHFAVLVASLICLQVRLLNNLWFSGKCADTDSLNLSRFGPEQVLLVLFIEYGSSENSS